MSANGLLQPNAIPDREAGAGLSTRGIGQGASRGRSGARSATIGLTRYSPWDEFQVAYFVGEASWNYLTAPFLFARGDTLVLKPGLVIHGVYNGYWYWAGPRSRTSAGSRAR